MKYYLRKFTAIAPFIMLGVTLFCAVCSSMDFYSELFVYLPDLLGYSIFTNLVFLYHYSFNKYCNVTRSAVVGLFVMNLVSIVTANSEYYNVMNDIWIGLIIIIVMIIYKVKRW